MVKIGVQPPLGLQSEKKDESSEVLICTTPYSQDLQAKQKRCNLCCLSFTLVIVLSGLVLASYFIYRYYSVVSWVMVCELHYDDEGNAYYALRSEPKMQEIVKFDSDDDYELIDNESDNAMVIHDFQKTLTAYLDYTVDECYITPMNTQTVMPPNAFHDLLVENGMSLTDGHIVKEEFTIGDEVDDIAEHSVTISYFCNEKKKFYMKQRSTIHRIDKREVNNCRTIRHFENTFGVETTICR
ncbi:integral membrane protein 2C-like isoform X2 [Protopterus annectens]|uniref:integral membrane protein 2C-like isoform X2 n=1 Tax=Protopterus annectens TaxID=7888 RepID=UPI001CF9D73E|nr:integral membrane protein 2C-like isoform X2 [Protopterus annectens]